ncbi:AT-rich interactive domain-containing protein 4B [Drosophila yakuba]|uniref:Uncharacterized protein n=1 Tax=Drosophila yakuba TaxID=7245 RepID=B4PIK0_DROYA|nr:AT-rich interactive domain-containing protein 4B [Drosophila yakuba]EDW94557.1 uncharacterized protein Dyak_GE19987 [Drosophila yakuba]
MRVFCALSLIAFMGIALISTKPLDESNNPKDSKLKKAELDKMMENLQLLEKLANDTYYSADPTTKETYLTKDPTAEETKEPTGEESREPTGEETNEPTGEETKAGEDGEDEEEDEEEDQATLDKPTEPPVMYLKYPEHEEDFKAYPRFAILRNGYVHHMNLDF